MRHAKLDDSTQSFGIVFDLVADVVGGPWIDGWCRIAHESGFSFPSLCLLVYDQFVDLHHWCLNMFLPERRYFPQSIKTTSALARNSPESICLVKAKLLFHSFLLGSVFQLCFDLTTEC